MIDERLNALLTGASTEQVLAFFDTLPPVQVAEMIGAWQGFGIPTGNRLDGLLERFGWHGKTFEDADRVHPLVFDAGGDRLVSINPSLVPLPLVLRHAGLLRIPPAAVLFRLARPLLRTSKPTARLRMTEYRGVVTATMCYDALPIHDAFRKVDEDTVLGLMDMRGLDPPFAFVLRRESSRA
jgi:hypothetical protein